jgi:hypothetical protein
MNTISSTIITLPIIQTLPYPAVTDNLKRYTPQLCCDWELHFDDALICQCMKEKNLKKLISYDAHFDKIGFIDRLTPDKLI